MLIESLPFLILHSSFIILHFIEPFLVILLIAIAAFFLIRSPKKKKDSVIVPANYKEVLETHVPFYSKLTSEDRKIFEEKLVHFLQRVQITGVKTIATDSDKVLVAAGAIVPIFGFENWEYRNLNEVLLYPGNFDESFNMEGDEKHILGMVGWGYMNGVMILSQHELRQDFLNKTGKDNTAIHEFVHLVDKTDGAIDGVPETLMSHHYAVPWIKLMHEEIQRIKKGKSDIDPYGASSEAEFFAVASEYFFERPELFKNKHPELFAILSDIFQRDVKG